MTKEEVLQKITSKPKYYVNVCQQSYASNTIRSIRNGSCKPDTETKFFEMFGYTTIKQPVIYKMTAERWFDELLEIAKKECKPIVNHIDNYIRFYNADLTPEETINKL